MSIAALLALALAADPPPAPDPEDIVVRARPRGEAPPPRPDPVAYLRRFCFDPIRLTGKPLIPEDDLEWIPLERDDRARLGLTDPAVPAFALFDDYWDMRLVIRFETKEKPIPEIRCTLITIGGENHKQYVGKMSTLFRAPGTQEHVGDDNGEPRIEGWDQHLWTAMPSRGSESWIGSNAGRRMPGQGWITVLNPSLFYSRRDLIAGDLKIRLTGDRPLSILTLARLGYPKPRSIFSRHRQEPGPTPAAR